MKSLLSKNFKIHFLSMHSQNLAIRPSMNASFSPTLTNTILPCWYPFNIHPLMVQITLQVLWCISWLEGGPQSKTSSSTFATLCCKAILFQPIISWNIYEREKKLNYSRVDSNENKNKTEVFSWTWLLPRL